MSNEQLSAADALRFGAQVIELYDDATMKDDHMLDAGECAGVLLALAEYLQRGARLPAASEPLDTLTISIDFDDGVTEEIEVHATGKMLGRLNVWLDRKRGKFHEAAASEAEPLNIPPARMKPLYADEDAPTEQYIGYCRGWNECRDWILRHAAAPVIRNSRIAGLDDIERLVSAYGYANRHPEDVGAIARSWKALMDAINGMARIAGDGEAGAVPLMHGIMGPDGKAYFDEYCVSNVPGDLDEIVQELNGGESDGDYEVIPMYARAAPPEKKQANACLWATVHPDCAQAAPPEKQASHSEGDAGDEEVRQEAFREFADSHLTDGNGYAPVSTFAACAVAFNAKWPDRKAADAAALAEYRRLHPVAPTIPHSLTVAQGDELRAALVRIRKHIGQHEIHGALKEVDAALTQLSGNSGELAQGERAAFEAHMNSTGFIWESDRERDVDGDEQYADVETRVNFGVWQAAIDWARQQGGGDAEQYVFAGTLCLDGYFISAKGRDDRGYSLYARMNGRPRMALDAARAQRAAAQGANDEQR